jgi:hypothetical protein
LLVNSGLLLILEQNESLIANDDFLIFDKNIKSGLVWNTYNRYCMVPFYVFYVQRTRLYAGKKLVVIVINGQ